MTTRFAGTPESWEKVGEALLASDVAGFDTEYELIDDPGGDPREHTALASHVIVWSVALLSGARVTGYGHLPTASIVLPGDAMRHSPRIREWLASPRHLKAAHNGGVDAHATETTSGIYLAGLVDTLTVARWAWPELVTMGGYGAKSMMSMFGLRMFGLYDELFTEKGENRVVVQVTKDVEVKTCACGVAKCRKRLAPHVKTVSVEAVTTEKVKVVPWERRIPLSEILAAGPAHPLWEKLLEYAALDADFALVLWQHAVRRKTKGNLWLVEGAP